MSLSLLTLMSGLGERWFIVAKKLMMNNYSENGMLPIMNGLIYWLDGRDGITNKDKLGSTYEACNLKLENGTFLANSSRISFHNTSFNMGKCSMEFMIKRNEVAYWGRIASLYDKSVNENTRRVITFNDSTNVNTVRYYNFANKDFITCGNTPVVMDNKYHHIYIQFNPCKLFIDGKDDTRSDFIIGDVNFDISELSLFSDLTGGNPIKCNLSSFRLYNRALTEEEILHNYQYEQSTERGE